MGSGLSVSLVAPDSASGLADMLQQYLQQTVDSSPGKARAAARIRGAVTVRAAEDPDIIVRVAFGGSRIDVADAKSDATPSIQGDFLSVAHLVSGTESAGRLLFRRRIAVRFRVAELPLLFGVARLLRIAEPSRWRGAAVLVAVAVIAVLVWLALK